jgi:hypothetical protein
MNRWLLGAILGIAAVIVVAPIMVLLFFMPLRAEYGPGRGNDNQVPSDLEALTVHDRLAIQLTWTPVNQGTSTYVLQRSEEGGGEESWEDVAELEPGAKSYLDDEGLRDGTTYLYRIYAWDPEGGSGYSNGTSATATALPQP